MPMNPRAQHVRDGDSPFVPIAPQWRLAIIGCVLVYNMLAPGLAQAFADVPAPLTIPRLWAEVLYQFLLFLPLFFYRRDYGWLHPLIFPAVFALAHNLARDPLGLLAPLLGTSDALAVESTSQALAALGDHQLALARLEYTGLKILALSAYYAGFFLSPSLPVPRFVAPQPREAALKAFAAIVFAGSIFVFYVRARGGISAHLLSFTEGRFRALGGDGPLMVLMGSASVALVIWYALDPEAWRQPLFWASAVFAVPVGFLAGGSRSAVIEVLITLLAIWMLRHRKLPAGRIGALAVTAFLFIGAAGLIRTQWHAEAIDWGQLTRVDVQELLAAGRQDALQREANEAGLAVVALGPEAAGFLWGKTYLAAVFFWVPRALWHDKPRGAGAYTAAALFRGQDIEEGVPRGGGIPPDGVAEAYWNFWIPGVVGIFLLFGTLHRWMARLVAANAGVRAVWPIYIIVLLQFQPTTIAIVETLQQVIPGLALLFWMGALGLRQQAARGRSMPRGRPPEPGRCGPAADAGAALAEPVR